MALSHQCNTFLGTVTYMSPERINAQQYSTPADIWSLGLALIECATGKYPYDASVGPLQLMMEVSAGMPHCAPDAACRMFTLNGGTRHASAGPLQLMMEVSAVRCHV